MKRGYPRGQQGVGGPLVTNHINDLDMELELLKRKRLIIEQQQQMLSNNRYDQQPYHRSQPQYDQHQNYSQSRNFSHFYDDGRQGGRNSQFGQNYQSVGLNWEHSNQYVPQSNESRSYPSKNFPYKPRNPAYPSKSRNYTQHNNKINRETFNNAQTFKPKYVPPSNRPNKSGPVHNVKKGFNPTKVTKPKNKASSNAPNNLNKQPVNTRKDLVAKAAPLCDEKPEEWVLRIDEKPLGKVVGRMELALGMLLKGFRKTYPQHAEFFANPSYLREIKRELRVRLRKVLLGKVVPSLQEIIDMYRAEFPVETDKSFLNLCQAKKDVERLQNLTMKFLPEDDPEQFFKINFRNVFEKQMDKFYYKLIEFTHKECKKSEEDIIAELPDMYVPVVVSAANDKVEENSGANEAVDQKAVESAKESSEQTENETADKQANGAGDADTENGNDKQQVVQPDICIKNIKLTQQEKVKAYKELIDRLIEKRLPDFIQKRQEDFLKILQMDSTYRTMRGGVLLALNKLGESQNKLPTYLSLISKDRTGEFPENNETETTPKKAENAPTNPKAMFYVKVVGKPTLPDKKRMKAFLDTFNSISIKKHKHINNLLIIGFASEADMDKILIANGTTIDEKTLVIATSGTQNKSNENDNSLNLTNDLENSITQLSPDVSIKEQSSSGQDGDVKMAIEKNENITQAIDENKSNGTDLKITPIKEESETPNADKSAVDATPTQELAPAKETVEAAKEGNVEVKNDNLEIVKDVQSGRATPTRASARLNAATPSTIRTRRASKLAQNN